MSAISFRQLEARKETGKESGKEYAQKNYKNNNDDGSCQDCIEYRAKVGIKTYLCENCAWAEYKQIKLDNLLVSLQLKLNKAIRKPYYYKSSILIRQIKTIIKIFKTFKNSEDFISLKSYKESYYFQPCSRKETLLQNYYYSQAQLPT